MSTKELAYTFGCDEAKRCFVLAVVTLGTMLSWIANIVPLGLGTSECGDYALFKGLEASGPFGIAFGIVQRLRKMPLVVIGLVLLGIHQARSRRMP